MDFTHHINKNNSAFRYIFLGLFIISYTKLYKIKCADFQATYIGETGRNLNMKLTEHKRATKNGDKTNHIAEHYRQTKHNIDWDSAECITYCTNYKQRITLESWYTNLEQEPLDQSQQLPAPYKTYSQHGPNKEITLLTNHASPHTTKLDMTLTMID